MTRRQISNPRPEFRATNDIISEYLYYDFYFPSIFEHLRLEPTFVYGLVGISVGFSSQGLYMKLRVIFIILSFYDLSSGVGF